MIIKQFIGNAFEAAAQLLAPNICLVCSTIIEKENRKLKCLCNKCIDRMPVTVDPRELTNRLIGSLPKDELAIDKAIGLINLKENHNYMNLIYNLKYYNYKIIGSELGKELAKLIQINHLDDFDIAIPVPIHSAKRRERGYNQSDLIAKSISEYLGKSYSKQIIKRSKYTSTQTRIARDSRVSNVSGAFEFKCNKSEIENKIILIADDVFTTGSTINSLALELMENGAKSIYAATLAVA